ncbi:hypothetical protein [Desulforhabdus sp. TSK]|uniref:hypothetical protein n=1 Tax=Desulforhabdus sp. TSK TaxID=2925014 RepID=UPI001FC8B71B|nr:hypothetical protein [Desulforhabdus sp. TSK]
MAGEEPTKPTRKEPTPDIGLSDIIADLEDPLSEEEFGASPRTGTMAGTDSQGVQLKPTPPQCFPVTVTTIGFFLDKWRELSKIRMLVITGVSAAVVVLAVTFLLVRTNDKERMVAYNPTRDISISSDQPPVQTGEQGSSPTTSTALERIGSQAVWNPPEGEGTWREIHEKCQGKNGGYDVSCIESMMREMGASVEAINVTRLMKSTRKSDADAVYMSEFRKMGKVDLARIVAPVWNDPNTSEFVLVNGTPEIVPLWDNVRNTDISKDRLYPSLVKRFPKMEIWPIHEFVGMQQFQQQGQRFVFSFALLNGCHACEKAGGAEIAFDFDSSGKFVGTRLIRLVGPEAAVSQTEPRMQSAASSSPDGSVDQIAPIPVHSIDTEYVMESNNLSNPQQSYVAERKITSVEPDRIRVSMRNLNSGYVRTLEYDHQWNLISSRGAAGEGSDYSPPIKYYDFPLQRGKRWSSVSTERNMKTGELREHRISAEVGGWETVSVPAGTFQAIKVMIDNEVKDLQTGQTTSGTDTSWYAPAVKRSVKSEMTLYNSREGRDDLQTLQLMSYSFKPAPVQEPNIAPVVPAPLVLPLSLKAQVEKELVAKGFPGVIVLGIESGNVSISGTEKYPKQAGNISRIISKVPGVADVRIVLTPSPQRSIEVRDDAPKNQFKSASPKESRPASRRGASIAPPSRDF